MEPKRILSPHRVETNLWHRFFFLRWLCIIRDTEYTPTSHFTITGVRCSAPCPDAHNVQPHQLLPIDANHRSRQRFRLFCSFSQEGERLGRFCHDFLFFPPRQATFRANKSKREGIFSSCRVLVSIVGCTFFLPWQSSLHASKSLVWFYVRSCDGGIRTHGDWARNGF